MPDAAADPIVLLVAGAALACVVVMGAYVGLASLAGRRSAIWVACFLVVFLLEAIYRVREFSDKSIDFQIIVKIISWCYAFAFAILRLPKYIGPLISTSQILWLLFLAWGLYTASYSPNPGYSVVALFSVTALFLYFMALDTVSDETAVVVAVSSALAAVSILSIIVYFAAPQLGRMSEWQNGALVIGRRLSGIVGTPNEMGQVAAFGLLLMAMRWGEIKQRLGSFLSLSFCLTFLSALIMSDSRTSLASVLLILGMKQVMRTRYLPWVILFAIAGVVCVLLIVPYSEQAMILVARSGQAAEIESGTARVQIWDTVIKLAETKFWSGWGYGSSVFVLPNYAAYMGETPPHAHNMLLQVWLTTGMIGLVLFLIACSAQALRSALRGDALAVSLLAFVIFNGLMEPGAFAGIAAISTVALAMAVARECGRRVPSRRAQPVRVLPAG